MNEEIIKKSRKSNFAFSSDRGGGKCTFTSFLQETGQRICRKPEKMTEFTAETTGTEKICCIDDNEEALLWRLRMIGTAQGEYCIIYL